MSDYFDRVESQIVQRVEEGLPGSVRRRPALGHLATAAAVLVVIVVAGVFLLARGAGLTRPAGPTAAHGVTVSLAPQGPVTSGTIAGTIQILRARLHQAVPGAQVSLVTGGRIVVRAPNDGAATRAQILALAAPGRLMFYDWEADVILPNGKTVASELATQDSTALRISQGSGTAAPGEAGAGSMSIAQALGLASKLGSGKPRRTEYMGRLTFNIQVPDGYVVVQAAGPGAGARFFLLRSDPALNGRKLTNPQPGTDPGGAPAVTFGFTAAGARKFQALTAVLARRGQNVSSPGQTLNQHFAVALDNRLIEVPYVDFRQYPDGISPGEGTSLSGGFTVQSAKDLAILLRYGPLPVDLTAAAG